METARSPYFSTLLLRDENWDPLTLTAVIKESKDIPGFSEFLAEFVDELKTNGIETVANSIINDAIDTTNFDYFRENRQEYFDFLCMRFREAVKAYDKYYVEEISTEDIVPGL